MDTDVGKNQALLRAGRCIVVVLPDDGTDHQLIKALHQERGLTRADSVSVRAVGMLHEAKTRSGKLPESQLAKMVTVVVDEADGEAVFDFIYAVANIGRLGGGMVLMGRQLGATPFVLPAGLADEPD